MKIRLFLDEKVIPIFGDLELLFNDYKFVISSINNLKGFIYNDVEYSLDKWYIDLDEQEIRLFYRNVLYWEI